MSKSKKTDKANTSSGHAIVIYESGDGEPRISVRIESETVWLNQAQMVDLFQSSKANVSEHIKHIFKEGELDKNSVVRNFRTVQKESGRARRSRPELS